ncbi:MAG: DMT family protein [Akkermansiaceae bacterium]|nr:DMT family protein [Akkermansia sp.]MCD7798831.1 DMT family protein [Akkermansiaceae bacterium]MCD8069927.1 DMT family protein [Akkermansiaceae bacterium]
MNALTAIVLLVLSNMIMTFAWYGHLKADARSLGSLALMVLASWGLAFFEYCLVIPANRIGFSAGLNVYQLKVIQEAIALSVFVPFAMLYMGESWKWDYLWAFFCLAGAVFFVNRSCLFPS